MIEHDFTTRTIRFQYELLPGEFYTFTLPDYPPGSRIPIEQMLDEQIEHMLKAMWKRLVED